MSSPSPSRLRGTVSTIAEVTIVLGIAGGMFGVAGVLRLVLRGWHTLAFSDARLLGTLAFEVVATIPLLWWLRRRGWDPLAVTLSPEPRDTVRGGGVWIASYVAYAAIIMIVHALHPTLYQEFAARRISGGVSALMVVLVSIVNPIFEEFLELGYIISRLRPYGIGIAMGVSVVFRTALHAYQGPFALVSILPIAIVYAVYYVRTGRLWPVIVAHIIQDALALSYMHRLSQ